uniref:Uncharacterized protein n=1 Tax=Photinus pyralis TaxID=7054 RepID=A0A1Y1JRI1_PHOPY
MCPPKCRPLQQIATRSSINTISIVIALACPVQRTLPQSSTMPSPNINIANISRRRSPISPTNPSTQSQSRPLSSNSDRSSSSTASLDICQYGTEGVGSVPAA